MQETANILTDVVEDITACDLVPHVFAAIWGVFVLAVIIRALTGYTGADPTGCFHWAWPWLALAALGINTAHKAVRYLMA